MSEKWLWLIPIRRVRRQLRRDRTLLSRKSPSRSSRHLRIGSQVSGGGSPKIWGNVSAAQPHRAATAGLLTTPPE